MRWFNKHRNSNKQILKPDDCFMCIRLGRIDCPSKKNDLSIHYGCTKYLSFQASTGRTLNDTTNVNIINKIPTRQVVKCPNCNSNNTQMTYGDRFECLDCGRIFN